MSAATATPAGLLAPLDGLGDWGFFSLRALVGALRPRSAARTLLPVCYDIGVKSVPVVVVTGVFIGMVLAVQAYAQFHAIGLDTMLGSMLNVSVIRELGPVLAAVMLAGRVGGAMAAELATMRVSEQIDALACLGVNPVHHLVTPRLVACVLLIPLLTAVADAAGVAGSAFICLGVYDIEPAHYWKHSREGVGLWDVGTGLAKATVFGAFIALISCHRGFHSAAGAAGVGRASTQAFVLSFIAILAADFVLAMAFNSLHGAIWPDAPSGMGS